LDLSTTIAAATSIPISVTAPIVVIVDTMISMPTVIVPEARLAPEVVAITQNHGTIGVGVALHLVSETNGETTRVTNTHLQEEGPRLPEQGERG